MLSEEHADRISAGVAADDRDDEGNHPAGTVGRDDEEHRETAEQRDVTRDEHPGRDACELVQSVGDSSPPDRGDDQQQDRDDELLGAAHVSGDQDRAGADHQRYLGYRDGSAAHRLAEFANRGHHDDDHEDHERDLRDEQRRSCDATEPHADRDCGAQVTAGLGRRRRRRPDIRLGH